MIKKRELFISLLIVALLFGMFSFSLALEIDYPSIGGKTLDETSGLTDFVAYFLNLALVLGTVISVVIVTYSGVNLVNSAGDPVKINEEKGRITKAILGMVVLFGFFILINYINPNILNIKNIEVKNPSSDASNATSGICLTYSSGEETSVACVSSNISNINNEITGIEWKSSAEDLPAIYAYSQENFIGVPVKVLNGASLTFSPKSIYLLWKEEGIILYDDVDFNLKGQSMPITVKEDSALLPQGFNGSVSSIKIINPSEGSFKYGTILFPESSYTGNTCSFIMSDARNLNNIVNGQENNPAININNVSSMIVMKISTASSGTVTFYNRANCESDSNDPDDKKKNICAVSGVYNGQNISESCPNFIGHVVSFELPDSIAILMKTGLKNEASKCQLFRKLGNSSCINMEKYGYIYSSDIDKPVYPQSFTLFPLYTEE